ncbi:Uncharacterised protein [Acetobacterium wieringae]|nr:Uncharacterised protein [Acetobacterium wieringae]
MKNLLEELLDNTYLLRHHELRIKYDDRPVTIVAGFLN